MQEPLKLLLQLAYVTSIPVSVTKASQVAKPDMGQKSIISDRQALKTIPDSGLGSPASGKGE